MRCLTLVPDSALRFAGCVGVSAQYGVTVTVLDPPVVTVFVDAYFRMEIFVDDSDCGVSLGRSLLWCGGTQGECESR